MTMGVSELMGYRTLLDNRYSNMPIWPNLPQFRNYIKKIYGVKVDILILKFGCDLQL